eukprot:CAMPEP_0167820818 /NCGR_PEP_ID=MMETSP0112_2-20121227/6357_1 /TAXON_ID=91324 /ORGANISM="Lotharella globosa, Strain CCCM811" /LENGTH=696 /DNA_ID=CAMNT_0007721527 /DNA_START=36 /DNA_END=2126 /DNA_ORIENTATION=+
MSIARRTKFQDMAEIHIYVKKHVRLESQRDTKKEKLRLDRDLRRKAAEGNHRVAVNSDSGLKQIKDPMKQKRKGKGQKSRMQRYKDNVELKAKAIMQSHRDNGVEKAKHVLQQFGGKAEVSKKIKMAGVAKKLETLCNKNGEQTVGPGHYHVDKESYMVRQRKMMWKVLNQNRPRTAPANLRGGYAGGNRAPRKRITPGPSDYNPKPKLRSRPKWAMPLTMRPMQCSIRETMSIRERLQELKSKYHERDALSENRRNAVIPPLRRKQMMEEKKEIREIRRRLAEARRSKIQEKRLSLCRKALEKSSSQYQEALAERRRQENEERLRQKAWVTLTFLARSVQQVKLIVERGRTRAWRRRVLKGMFEGPWKDLAIRVGGPESVIHLLRRFLFRRTMNKWFEQQLTKKRRMVKIILHTLTTCSRNKLKQAFATRMWERRNSMVKLQHIFRHRRRIFKWRYVILCVQMCKAKLVADSGHLPRKRRKLFELLFENLIPSLDKIELFRVAKSMFDERRSAFNLACLKHHSFYKRELENMLLKLFGAGNAQIGLEYSQMDFEMVCEMLQSNFPEEKAKKVFEIMDEDRSGYVSFAEFLDYYFKRFQLHEQTGGLPPTDPIDQKVKDLVFADFKPRFRLGLTSKEQRQVARKLKRLRTKQLIKHSATFGPFMNVDTSEKDDRKKAAVPVNSAAVGFRRLMSSAL